MNIKHVTCYIKPKYPDKYEIELNQALLYYRPQRWTKEPLISLALSAFVAAGLSGCSGPDYGRTMGPPMAPDTIYISDNDALGIIADELINAGFDFDLTGDVDDFKFDARIINGEDTINLEYVSKEDCAIGKYPSIEESTYTDCYSKDIAAELKDIYKDAAIFYDPETYDFAAERELRAQVFDFIEWLRSTGTEG